MKEYLSTPKEVMQALLDGHKLQNSEYAGEEHYIYLSDTGQICEEDGAGCKSHRFPITTDAKWWIYE